MKDNKYRVTSFRDEIFIDEENIEEVIYRLNTKYEMMNALYEDSEEEIERLHSIIKEAREYIEKNSDDMHTYISQILTDILKGSDKD